jgi:hypothetical protein
MARSGTKPKTIMAANAHRIADPAQRFMTCSPAVSRNP